MNRKKFVLFTFAMMTLVSVSHAEKTRRQAVVSSDEPNLISQWSAGGMLGLGIASNGLGTNFVFGAQADYRILPELGIGAYFSYNGLGVPAPLSMSDIFLGAQANYYFSRPVQGLYAGGKLGLAFVSLSAAGFAGFGSGTFLLIGPAVGYDFQVNSDWSVGAETSLLFATSSHNVFNILATGKYHF